MKELEINADIQNLFGGIAELMNGLLSISDTLIQQANLRTHDAVLRVFSYSDTTTTAEGGKPYHVWGGTEGAVLLQGLR